MDPYAWLRERGDPDVVRFIEANNDYAVEEMAHTQALQTELLGELNRLVPPNEGTPPVSRPPWVYEWRYEPGHNFMSFFRRRADGRAPEDKLVDVDELARGSACFVLGDTPIAPGGATLGMAVDQTGRQIFTIRFYDMRCGHWADDELRDVDGHFVWGNDGLTVYYTELEPKTLRPFRVRRHVRGQAREQDRVLYEEADGQYRCLLTKTANNRSVRVTVFSDDSDESLLLNADDPDGEFVLFKKREKGCEYHVDEAGDYRVVTEWKQGIGCTIYEVDEVGDRTAAWRVLERHGNDCPIESVEVFRDRLAIIERHDGNPRLRIRERVSGASHEVDFEEPSFSIWFVDCADDAGITVRFGYTSLVTPVCFFDYDMIARKRTLLQQEDIPGYRQEHYVTIRRWARALDGTRIPITLVSRRDTLERGAAPLLLFGYGAYGTTIPPYFDQSKLVLLNRGFVYAMAHIRGGGEYGRAWHDAGRRGCKMNTMTDFIACAEFLIDAGIARRDAIVAESLSAGGLMIGAIVNMRPDLFKGVVAEVCFFDLLNAMSDPDLPWTLFERGEWGDPDVQRDWDYMKGYAPYENIRDGAHPDVLATAGFNDAQVPFWEPAKWVARLRDADTGEARILLRTNMKTGHAGISGRIRKLNQFAFTYAFMLDLVGLG